jgi:apolipoprotein N-acyltransferase
MTILLTLIIAITLGELFKRIFKSKILGFLVTTTALIWIYGEIVKGKTVFDILVSMISLLAFFIAAFFVALKLLVKKQIPQS